MKTPNVRPPKTAPTPPTAPRGMWFETRAGNPLPFLARWRLPGGRKDSQAFETERDRAAFAEAWAQKRKNYGRAAVHVSPRDAEALAEFRKITGGADLLTVARDWLKWRGVTEGGLLIKDAVRKYREAMSGGGASAESSAQRDLHLERLVNAFPDGTLADLNAEAICACCATLPRRVRVAWRLRARSAAIAATWRGCSITRSGRAG